MKMEYPKGYVYELMDKGGPTNGLEPYSPVYMTCIEQAKKDLREKARPELTSYPDSIDGYDTVILAYPNY